MKRKRSMPSCDQISHHWMQPESNALELMGYAGESYGIFDDEFVKDECWACGRPYPTGFSFKPERCHVVSKWEGGSDDCSNLVLLCSTCHQESENYPPVTFWTWIKNMRKVKWKNNYEWRKERLEMAGINFQKLADEAESGKTFDQILKNVCDVMGLDFNLAK